MYFRKSGQICFNQTPTQKLRFQARFTPERIIGETAHESYLQDSVSTAVSYSQRATQMEELTMMTGPKEKQSREPRKRRKSRRRKKNRRERSRSRSPAPVQIPDVPNPPPRMPRRKAIEGVDWRCHKCRFLNFEWRMVCYICKENKPLPNVIEPEKAPGELSPARVLFEWKRELARFVGEDRSEEHHDLLDVKVE